MEFWQTAPESSPRFCFRGNLLLDSKVQLCTELAFMYFMYCECSEEQNTGLNQETELLQTNRISTERCYKLQITDVLYLPVGILLDTEYHIALF